MNEQARKRISKFLSFVLRHHPDEIGLQLDEAGWVSVDVLLDALPENKKMSRKQLEEVVALNDKQRFQFNDKKSRIRARQGHSIDVELGYEATPPPEMLFHGTPATVVDLIRESGLKKQQRHHVHLHENVATAKDAGGRRGKPVLLVIRSRQMHDEGFEFFVTENGVWLTDHVPPRFIDFPD